MFVFPKAERLAIVNLLIADADFVSPILHLYQNDVTPNRDSLLADFTEADFTGYAASTAITWGAAFLNANEEGVSAGGAKTFAATAATVGNSVFGWYMLTALGALLAAGRFDAPLSFVQAGDGAVLVPQFKFGGADNGAMVVVA